MAKYVIKKWYNFIIDEEGNLECDGCVEYEFTSLKSLYNAWQLAYGCSNLMWVKECRTENNGLEMRPQLNNSEEIKKYTKDHGFDYAVFEVGEKEAEYILSQREKRDNKVFGKIEADLPF